MSDFRYPQDSLHGTVEIRGDIGLVVADSSPGRTIP